jgi:translation initiation factor 2 alpha subunit (eIF-2alpha)
MSSEKIQYEEDNVVLCKVKKIEGTTVFVETEDGFPGSIVLSEVSAGRIRNLRKYVSPNKLIVCKILKVMKDHLELSLRRVTSKEKEHVLENHKREKALISMLKVVGGSPGIVSKIKEEYEISDFMEEAKDSPKILEKFMSAAMAKKIGKIISEKEGKEKKVEKRFILNSDSSSGVEDIREILSVCSEGCEVHYLGSGKFSICVSGKDFKIANERMEELLGEIEKRAKKKSAVFDVGKEKR